MRGGLAHDLVLSPEHTQGGRSGKYRCNGCGEGYQVRTSAPSCRVRLLEQMEQLDAPYGNLAPAARRALLEELVRRRFKWPKPFRESCSSTSIAGRPGRQASPRPATSDR